tara:strand:+ start:514 stop:807 length:294 start_codon:yes stop_codon:yes gene_type:complete
MTAEEDEIRLKDLLDIYSKEQYKEIIEILNRDQKRYHKEQCTIPSVSSSTEHKKHMVWDELFGILAWKFKQTKSGDMYLDGEKVYNELKEKFELKRK